MENKEVAIIEKKVTKVLTAIQSLKIVDEPTLIEAGEIRKNVKDLGKELKTVKDGILKPLKESIDKIKGLFAPAEEKYEAAEQLLNNQILNYQKLQEEKRRKIEREAQEKIEQARRDAEKGKISEKKLEQIETKIETKLESAPTVTRKTETFHTRTIKKVRVINEKLVPREYLILDMPKINQAVKSGIVVPGCELYEENTLI